MTHVCGSTVSYRPIKILFKLQQHMYTYMYEERQSDRQTERERKTDRETERQIGLVTWPKYRYYGNTLLNAAKRLIAAF